ncbi:MAG: nucleoside-diphosphate kinase [Minisyncoccia bacterium]
MDKFLNFKKERTLILIKPEGVERKLIGEIISRIERTGLDIIGLGILKPSKRLVDRHYPKNKEWIKNVGIKNIETYKEYNLDIKKIFGTDNPYKIGKMVRKWLVDYISSGPVVKILVEGPHAINIMRKLTGNTRPYIAEPGTIRGDFSFDSPILANLEKRPIKNIIHASDSKKEAEREIKVWFKKEEILKLNK